MYFCGNQRQGKSSTLLQKSSEEDRVAASQVIKKNQTKTQFNINDELHIFC